MLNYSANGPSGYNLTNSLRFRGSNSAYLSRTAGTPTSAYTWTMSLWFKLGTIGGYTALFGAGTSPNLLYMDFAPTNNGSLNLYAPNTGATLFITTTQVFRDPSAWYHLVIAVDTTQTTASNRFKIYVNGSQITSFIVATYPSLNSTFFWNQSGIPQRIGSTTTTGSFFDGYMTEVNFVDGQQLTPSSFGNTNSTTGVWQPAKYTGAYGNNGFYLKFADTSAATAAAIGKDSSGNGNNWTPNNISVTAGTTYDAMTDVPTLTSATVANYAVLNPLTPTFSDTASASITNGNLTVTGNGGYGFATIIPTSGKWYFETVNNSANVSIGIWFPPFTQSTNGYSNTNYRYYGLDGNLYNQAGTVIQSYSTYGNADIIGVALDLDNGKVYFSKNNTWQGSSNPVTGTNPAVSSLSAGWVFGVASSSGNIANANFGQRPFTYTPPTGYVALNTYNLPIPTILQGNKYMDATLYTGNGGATQTITNAALFKPDFVWVKSRSAAYRHGLFDSVRGVGSSNTTDRLQSNATDAQDGGPYMSSLNSNGFTITNYNATYTENATTYVGWQWQASNTTAVSGTGTGGVTSVTYSANTTAGFSIVQYTEASSGTATHGLGVAPSFIITKDLGGANNWNCYHISLGATKRIQLNSTAAADVQAGVWNNTAPTSTVFTLGSSLATAGAQIAYCFAEIAGFSKFGSYTGNGSTDGTFVYLGFRPKFVMIKLSSSAGDGWVIQDTSRFTYNVVGDILAANLATSESGFGNGFNVNYLSNGFKLRYAGSTLNGSGSTYIYMAFAENPFKNALAR